MSRAVMPVIVAVNSGPFAYVLASAHRSAVAVIADNPMPEFHSERLALYPKEPVHLRRGEVHG